MSSGFSDNRWKLLTSLAISELKVSRGVYWTMKITEQLMLLNKTKLRTDSSSKTLLPIPHNTTKYGKHITLKQCK